MLFIPDRVLIWFLAGVVMLGGFHGDLSAAEGSWRSAKQKATFLANCAHFIEWPATAFSSGDAPLTIGVFGDDPFGPALEEVARNSTSHGRNIQIVHPQTLPEARECHLLFIGRKTKRLGPILSDLKGRSVVTVGETDSFLAAGGMIALLSERTNVRLRINSTMVNAANVTMSSKLLRIGAQR